MTTQETIVDKIKIREDKGKLIAGSKTIYKIMGKDMFYVESESEEGRFYYIGYNKKEEIEFCSCLDNSIRGSKCKHLFAVENAIVNKTMVQTDRFPNKIKKPEDNELQYKNEDVYSL